MANQEIKIMITADPSSGISGINQFKSSMTGMQSSSEGLSSAMKEHWMGISAAVASAALVANEAMKYMVKGAQALQQESSFKIMAEEAGASAQAMIASMKSATKETIDDSDLMQKATKLMLAGYNPDQIERFSKVAITASQYMGVSVGESFDRISDALASRMPKAMVQSGAVTKEQMTIVAEAMKAGADTTSLMELAIDNLNVKQLKLQGTQDEATLSMQRFTAQTEEAKESIGKGLLYVTQSLYGVFQSVDVAALELTGGLFKVVEGFDTLVSHLPGTDKMAWEQSATRWKAEAEAAFGAAGELAKKAEANMYHEADVGKKATSEEIKNAQTVVDAQMNKFKSIAEAAKNSEKIQKDILKSLEEASKSRYEQEISDAKNWLAIQRDNGAYELDLIEQYYGKANEALWDHYSREWDAIEKTPMRESEKNAKLEALNTEYYKILGENRNNQTKDEIDEAQKIIDVNAQLYKTIDEFSDKSVAAEIAAIKEKYKKEGEHSKDLIALAEGQAKEINDIYLKQAKAALDYYDKTNIYAQNSDKLIAKLADAEYQRVLKATKNEEVAAKARTDFVIQENLKKAEASDSFSEGFIAQMKKLAAETYTWGKAGSDAAKGMSDSMTSTFSAGFLDLFKGNLKSADDYFKSFSDSMLKTFSDILAKMVTEAITKKIVMAFDASWSEGAASVLNAVGKVLGYAADWYFGGSSGGTNGGLNAPAPSGGAINVAYGGLIPGYAMGGDSYSNDTVPAWLSPGEYVVPRSMMAAIAGQGKHGDTILAHINTQEAALLKTLGGSGTINERTGLPQFWGFSDLVNIATGGVSGLLNIGDTSGTDAFINPLKVSVAQTINAKNLWDVIDAAFDPVTGPGITKLLNETGGVVNGWLPWLGQLVNMILPIVGGVVAGAYSGANPAFIAAGAAAGSGVASKWNSYSNEEATERAAIAAATAYIGSSISNIGSVGTAATTSADTAGQAAYQSAISQGMDEAAAQSSYDAVYHATLEKAFSDALGQSFTSVVKDYTIKWVIGQMLNAAFPAENSKLGISYDGMSGGADMASLISGLSGKTGGDFAFSAMNGLNYVPRDNFYIRAHEGEAVLTKGEAQDWRSGGNGGDLLDEIRSWRAEHKVTNVKIEHILEELNEIGILSRSS